MITRRTALISLPMIAAASRSFAQQPSIPAAPQPPVTFDTWLDRAAGLGALKVVMISLDGSVVAQRAYHGHGLDASTNIKSASKSIISCLTGIAIDKGLLEGPDQRIAPILKADLPARPDPRVNDITIGNLLSMQSGLSRMSGPNYGRWVSSRNWVRFALAEPLDGEPGGDMLYSTASTHLLSAILSRVGQASTLQLARTWLSAVEGFHIGAWERDPQGIYLGGNQMAMTARSLLAFGELYRNGGRNRQGQQIVSQAWIDQSWTQRTTSRFSGDGYGYGWFLRRIGGEDVRFGWGYGGQMLYIVPRLRLTVVMTSEDGSPSARSGYRDQLHDLLANIVDAARLLKI